MTEESIHFLESREKEKPFLLYLSYYNIHTPVQAYKKHIDRYEKKAQEFSSETPTRNEHEALTRMRQDNPALASMVAAVDDSVGALLEKLGELRLADDTVIIFFSDNGGLSTKEKPGPGCNFPLRAGKGWLYEGGVREPTIVRAPGVTQAGSICEDPVVSMDFFPTMLDLAGLPLKPNLHVDGRSLLPELTGKKGKARTLYWHYPHYHGSTWKPGASIRDGKWKLIKFYDYEKVELYNLIKDPFEKNDLSQKNSQKTRELEEKLVAWQTKMKAKLPRPNPDYLSSLQKNK